MTARTLSRVFQTVVIALAIAHSNAVAQQQPIGAVALGDLVQGLGINTRVLVIGAHPDDEDTYLISWLARGRHVETAYLSLTRGEGGQNLIGNELGYALGMIRTEELLAARRVDGAHQYFTRAVDFGFSKTFAEADSLWPHDLILKDVVTVIRAFRPHVIVSVWTGTDADGHGHHQYAGVIAKEAFEQAATADKFPPMMTSGLPVWSPSKFYRTVRVEGGGSVAVIPSVGAGNVTFNVGEYNPLIGRSYAELAALSRSQHLSQGMGMLLPQGTLWDAVHLDTSRVARPDSVERSIFDGIDTTWARFANLPVQPMVRNALDSLPDAVRAAQARLDAGGPGELISLIGRVLRLARSARMYVECPEVIVVRCGNDRADLTLALNTTIDRATRAMLVAAGVVVEATSDREQVALNDSMNVTVSLFNRGRSTVEVVGGKVIVEGASTDLNSPLVAVLPDSALRLGGRVEMPSVTYPWWLLLGANDKRPIYNLADGPNRISTEMVLGEDRVPASHVELALRVDGINVRGVSAPIVYRYADPARGEQRHPLAGVPKITTRFQSSVEYIRSNTPVERGVRVIVHSAWSKPDTVNVALAIERVAGHSPVDLRPDSIARQVVLPPYGTASAYFRLKGNIKKGVATPDWVKVSANVVDRVGLYRQGFLEIDYDHIRPVRFFQPPELFLSAVDVRIPPKLEIAYVRGVGDDIELALEDLGLKAHAIRPDALSTLDLTPYNALVIGPRAYEAIEAVSSNAAAIQNFARRGGTVVVQHTQVADKPGVLPYPVTLATPSPDRVTDEKAPVVFLDSMSRLMNYPNRITHEDFDGWVSERALLMPTTYDPHYKPLFSMHDKGEAPNTAAVLVTPLGKGVFIYTTLSFFRQLPSGNAGAARLFVNLLSAGIKPVP